MTQRSIRWLPTGLVAALCGCPIAEGASWHSLRKNTTPPSRVHLSGTDHELPTASLHWATSPDDPRHYEPPAESLNAHPND
jgi:hypothetical protein